MIIGNEKQKIFLSELLENLNQGTILVFGPEGVGKFSFLKEFLQAKNGEIIFLDSEDKILKIETARLLVSLGIKRSEKRIIIINDAHKFQFQAQNTLLKTLEEALSKTIFILITHRFHKILPTIRSRSILVRFGLVPEKETFNFLKEKGYVEEEIKLALSFYPGQPGKALNFLENKNKINLFKKFVTTDTWGKLSLIESEELKNNFSLQEFLEIYLLFLRKKIKEKPIPSFQFYHLLNLYNESIDYNLNFDLQLTNLVLNYG